MAVVLTLRMEATVAETITIGTPQADDANSLVTHDGMNIADDLNAASPVPATKVAVFNQALSGGAATIDLTALVGTNLGAVTFLGLKVQCLFMFNPLGNNDITIADGVANGYGLGGADFKVVLHPGQGFLFRGLDLEADVAGGAKDIDITGTGVEELECTIVAG